MGSWGWQYDVALSYAGEDRVHARELATRIQTAGYSIFYDEFEELWGEDLSVKLHEVYGKQSRFCVILVSKHYLKKPWTNMEQIFESLKRILRPPRLAAVQLVKRQLEDIIVRMHPRNFLGIVVQKDNVKTPAFNLDGHLINESRKPGRIQRLEVMVTPSGKRGIQFTWNLFYEFLPGGQVMEKISDAAVLELGPEESRLLGVQFVGPRLDWELLWSAGEYEFVILGWVNRGPRELEADLRTKFRVEISHRESLDLNSWAQASNSMWEWLHDPHNAVALPVTIDKSTLIVG